MTPAKTLFPTKVTFWGIGAGERDKIQSVTVVWIISLRSYFHILVKGPGKQNHLQPVLPIHVMVFVSNKELDCVWLAFWQNVSWDDLFILRIMEQLGPTPSLCEWASRGLEGDMLWQRAHIYTASMPSLGSLASLFQAHVPLCCTHSVLLPSGNWTLLPSPPPNPLSLSNHQTYLESKPMSLSSWI